MRNPRPKSVALIGAAVLIGTSLLNGAAAPTAQAQQATGTAPFVNSWLVSGPFTAPVVDKTYGCEGTAGLNLSRSTSAITASSSLSTNSPAWVADGTVRNQWVTSNDTAPWITLHWATPISLNEVRLAQWGDSRHINQSYQLTFTLQDGSTVRSPRVASTSSNPASPTVYTHATTLLKVVSLKVEVDPGLVPYPTYTGVSEIEVYNRARPTDGQTTIAPTLGGNLAYGTESAKWEYFDDRLYNRNYDDYQDLYGYYSVKKGVDTRNKYVYAHTYVYSSAARKATVNVGASGSYRLYVNDRCLIAPTTPVEVQKDLTKQVVDLKAGWNKVLVQIKHTYTEDLNANGAPAAQDQNVAYLGFYGRVSDELGNRISGVTNAVSGPAAALQIDTRALSTANPVPTPLPGNSLPTGYLEWPYVWNKSNSSNQFGVGASAFQFLASGGTPGYTWRLTSGALPDGLELKSDGTIADGLVDGKIDLNSQKGIISRTARIGNHAFTVEVRDAAGATVTKAFTITVKDRPNRRFEEGRVSALTHATASYTYYVDPNYSVDKWAARAKQQGHSMVSIEALQQNYYWPSKFADPLHEKVKYLPTDANGKIVDGLKPYADAVKRYGMDFGLYYATEGGGMQHRSTDVFVQNVEDLMTRYGPTYLYFDGPQAMPGANFDVMYSAVRNRSADVVIDSNAWGVEYGDPDLRTAEASGIFANAGANTLVKRTPVEPWKMIRTQNQVSPYYGQRDDFRLVAQEMVMNAGRGYVDNNDQTVIDGRGPNWHTPTEMSTRYPKGVQEFITVREAMVDWFTPNANVNLHESTTGTYPYFLSGYGYTDDGRGNYEKFARPNATTGPQWGYATSRDNNIYLHIMKGPDGKTGFASIVGKKLTIAPVKHTVTSVTLLNKDLPISTFTQSGETLTIDLSAVAEDPIDTIIRITTADTARKYRLTNVDVDAVPLATGKLKLSTRGYMTYPALKTKLSSVTYSGWNPAVASVDSAGVVTPVANGSTSITVTGVADGVSKVSTIKVAVKNGIAYVGDGLIGSVLRIGGKETFGTFASGAGLDYTLDGRSALGRSVRLDAATVTWHAGTVNLSGGTKTQPVAITEVTTFGFANGKVTTPQVTTPTRGIVWAEVELDGKTVTSNRVFLDLLPTRDLGDSATITASHSSASTPKLTDETGIDATHLAGSGWSAPAVGASWVQFKLTAPAALSSLDLTFNSAGQKYLNAPKTITIQTSNDGVTWSAASAVTGPTGSVFSGVANSYPLTGTAQYVRVTFAGGSAGSALDLLEVAINGK